MIARPWIQTGAVVLAALFSSCGRDLEDKAPSAGVSRDRESGVASPGARAIEEPVERGRIRRIQIGNLYQLREEGRVLLVDVRPSFFFKLGHIPGALSLPLKSFDSVFPDIRPQIDAARNAGSLVVLYCANEECPDSLTTARKLSELGYSSVVYSGGWKEWKAAGF